MVRLAFLRAMILIIITSLVMQPIIIHASDSYRDIYELAEENMKELEEGIINLQKFCGEPWYKRHMGKLIAGGVIVVGGALIFFTAGAATGPVAGGASHILATSAAGTGLSVAAGGTVAAGVYVDSDGNIVIPADKKQQVYNFYRENYSTWVARSSSKKEFGEMAIAEIVKYLENNK